MLVDRSCETYANYNTSTEVYVHWHTVDLRKVGVIFSIVGDKNIL